LDLGTGLISGHLTDPTGLCPSTDCGGVPQPGPRGHRQPATTYTPCTQDCNSGAGDYSSGGGYTGGYPAPIILPPWLIGSYTHYLNTTYRPNNPYATGAQLQLGSLAGFCGQGLITSSPCGTSLTTQLIIAFTGLGALAGSIITPAGSGPEDEQPGDPTAEAHIQTAAEQDLTNLECGAESFTPGTTVLLASGTAVPIASLKPGDKVLATNVKTGKTQAEPITAVLVHHDTNRYNLTIETAHGTTVIHTTTTHLFWDPYLKQWRPASKLRKGEHLKTADGVIAVADGGITPKQHDGWMWDLTIAADHDFYIQAGPGAVLVHNCPVPGAGSDSHALESGYTEPTELHHVLPQQFRSQFEKGAARLK
jgi:hypothetical protein